MPSPHGGKRAPTRSGGRRKLFQNVDHPGRGLQDGDLLRQAAFPKSIVEQPERAFVRGMAARTFAELGNPRDQFGPARLDFVVALAKAFARRGRSGRGTVDRSTVWHGGSVNFNVWLLQGALALVQRVGAFQQPLAVNVTSRLAAAM